MLPVGFDAVHYWVGLNWLVAWEVPVNTAFQGMMLAYTLQNSNARAAVIAERYLDRIVALDRSELGRIDKVITVPLIPELADFNRRFGTRVNIVFNMTEISSRIEADYDETAGMPVTACGRTRPGYDLRVVDEHDQELPRGQLGELIVRSDDPRVLNAGYLNMAEKTAKAWRNGWFHTGDGFMQDANGWFHFVDRQKDAIRRRGENISSMEVEAHVNTHPAVLESAAIAVASEWGEDEVMIVVVLKPSASLQTNDLHTYLSPIIPKFMLPRFIDFADALPKTPTEKVRKVALREAGITSSTWDASANKSR